MRTKTIVIVTALVLLIAAGSIITVAVWPKSANWPDLPSSPDGSPIIYAEVQPDFGYRIGDVLSVTIFIKQCAGTTVDVDSIALEGDFEIKGDHTVTRNKNSDSGCEMIAIKLNLQSFELKDILTTKVSLTWNKNGSADYRELTTPALAVHLSRVYDGRNIAQKGEQTFLSGNHLLISTILSAIGLSGTILCLIWLWHFHLLEKRFAQFKLPARRALVKAHFEEVWARIMSGDLDEHNFREINSMVREFLGIETIVISRLPRVFHRSNFRPHALRVLFILDRCEKVIFRNRPLSENDLQRLAKAFDEFINNKIFASDEYLLPKFRPKRERKE